MFGDIREYLFEAFGGAGSEGTVNVILLLAIAVTSVASYYLVKLLLSLIERAVLRSPTDWDDDLINPRLLQAVSQLAPALMVNWMIPGFFGDDPSSMQWLRSFTAIYIVWAGIYIGVIFIGNVYEAMLKRPKMQPYAIKGVFQTIKLIFIGIGVIIGCLLYTSPSPRDS